MGPRGGGVDFRGMQRDCAGLRGGRATGIAEVPIDGVVQEVETVLMNVSLRAGNRDGSYAHATGRPSETVQVSGAAR